ncbi:1-phosphofructokinase family hexose kinase [Sinomonas sp. ASV322]|uniref:1-phosphofructokinase family hexose kinase n=1 Tax=Sinomonas sp. ASV322 TaxID=3041920 RepID=UPI0027DB48CF|nr:1-phosphofructokinase family hexose kinase [Sinomonas sp. ASV322]MDQ4501328.1 1-phosphofructokinase family hexose kinase [Sinomonas sp. ASV322]
MIVTLTANPSLDRTVELGGPLLRGEVQRAVAVRQESGGKGVNVSRALVASGLETVAVLPGDPADPVLAGLEATAVPFAALPIGQALRSNVTLTEPGGVTTKVNEPGPQLDADQQAQLLALLVKESGGATWVVLAGSLPPGVPTEFYTTAAERLRAEFGDDAPKIAIDSSGAPLAASLGGRPDLLKPNADELAELAALVGLPDVGTPAELEASPERAATAARSLVEAGVGAVLATLGAKGAVLVTADGAWFAAHSPIKAVSTVGAGDSSLAGYLLADISGADAEGRLRQAVAHGAAAASLPGSTVPAVNQTDPSAVTITALTKD